jgi:Tfp pilus assembly protein PilF
VIRILVWLAMGFLLEAQTADPLSLAYAALQRKQYEAAVAFFRQAIAADAKKPSVYKDLAYTLLKIGETEAARDAFAEAMRLDPNDYHVALEYGFLCFETKQPVAARRTFDRIRRQGDPASRATAEGAFRNIDGPLAEGITRWQQAVNADPNNFSAHRELASLAEQRDDAVLAATHYEQAWRIRPSDRALLLDLSRVWREIDPERSRAALLAASRGAEPRVAETARERLPTRYPYVYEFRNALAIDPANTVLRRELAYLLLEMDKGEEAEAEFRAVLERSPDDLLAAAQLGLCLLGRKDTIHAKPLLDRVLAGPDEELANRVRVALHIPQVLRQRPGDPPTAVSAEAKAMAERSFQVGYLQDAAKYYELAHEKDPSDYGVMLKLGWTYNMLHRDEQAIQWFDQARRSPEPQTAAEAERAYKNLRPEFARFRTTAWVYPMYSSRWKDLFSYGQVKTEIRLGRLPFRPYLSARFIGDTRHTLGGIQPQYLSETSLILGVGIGTATWHGLRAWAER